MELRRMTHLVALADTRNFSRAAERCHLSQPAFSRSIQAAEDELGLTLFERGTHDVRCTDAGTFVVARVRKLLFDNHCLARDVSLYRDRALGDVAFGVGPYPAATLVPQLLIELRTHHAGVNARVEVNNARFLAERLRNEELDFFLADVRNVAAAPEFAIRRIGQLPGGFYVRTGHPLLAQDHVVGADLRPYGIAGVRLPEPLQPVLARLLGAPEDGRPLLAVECDDLTVLRKVVMASDTVLACPHADAADEVRAGRLVGIPVADIPLLYSELGVVSLKGRSYSPMAQFAVDYLATLTQRQALPA